MSIRVGLLGYGIAGRLLHAPLIDAAGMEIAAIVTSRAEQASADFPSAAILATPEELVARNDIDLVIIVTPDHFHVAHTRIALEAGKHVVVDKPFAPTSAEALALIALAKQRGRMLTVYQNRRWDADFLTVRKLVGSGALGEIMLYQARWDRYRPAARGDWHDDHMLGELFGLGPHLVDQALTLFGTPDWIQADVFNQRGVASFSDGFEIQMAKGKTRIALGCNYLAADEPRSYRVVGAKATFLKDGLDPQEPHLRLRKPVRDPHFGIEDEGAWGVIVEGGSTTRTPVTSERGDWLSFYRGVRAALENNAPPPVDAREAARVIAVLEAAIESSESGRRIDLPAFLTQRGL